jgi:hypothetical protein
MPKNTFHGPPSYDGYVDVSPEGVAQPEWVAVVDISESDDQLADEADDYELPDEEPEPIELTPSIPQPRGKHESES